MIYPRRILKQLEEQIATREIIVLTGMRRVGKTTLYRGLFDDIKSKNKVFLDIENPIEQKIFEEEDFNNIWRNLKIYNISTKERSYIFLDEIQAMPSIVNAIKYLYDHYDVKFFLTGSSSFYLKNIFPESLAGRKIVFEIDPLDFEEFLIFKNKKKTFYKKFKDKDKNKNIILYEKFQKDYDEYLKFGGFPQVVLTENLKQKKLQINDIFKSYFEKEVMGLADFKNVNIFRDLLLLLMQRVGSKLEINKLAKEVGVTRTSIYNYLSFLEKTYFISLITPYTKNIDREIGGTKKIYFCDNGIINQFASLSGGSLLENAVFNNLKKYGKINYYQKRSGKEVDFVLMDQGIALEVKNKGHAQDLNKLESMTNLLNLKQYYIITKKFVREQKFIPVVEL